MDIATNAVRHDLQVENFTAAWRWLLRCVQPVGVHAAGHSPSRVAHV